MRKSATCRPHRLDARRREQQLRLDRGDHHRRRHLVGRDEALGFHNQQGVHMKAFVCRLLIVLMAWTPYQFAQAGMIGTDQVISTAAQAERGSVLNFVNRADVASQLQSFGIDASTAKDRVAALTDEEVRYLAGRIDSMPAGANGSGLLLLIIIVAVIWWVWKR